MSQNSLGNLETSSATIKNNLRTYISKLKMINDTIDILDAKIINLRVSYNIIAYPDVDKFDALDSSKTALLDFYNRQIRNRRIIFNNRYIFSFKKLTFSFGCC